jgi:hypothetical protein
MKKVIKQLLSVKTYRYLKRIRNFTYALYDFVFAPITFLAAFWLRFRRKNLQFSPISKKIFNRLGVFPILDHYYEPMFNPKYLRKSLREDRILPAIDFNVDEQRKLLATFCYNDELLSFPRKRTGNEIEFSYDYGSLASGDSENWYNVIRKFKPKKIIEIGCGSSTLMALNAIQMNRKDEVTYKCDYTCIEPFEQPWLEKTGLKVIRSKVEEISLEMFKTLSENDILFIDSSHIIRSQGDVLFEILVILPILNSGVIVHFHDINTPKDYFDEYILKSTHPFWNEQYLLEAFLSFNKEFKIILASNYLFHHHKLEFIANCPILELDLVENPEREVASFWIKKI